MRLFGLKLCIRNFKPISSLKFFLFSLLFCGLEILYTHNSLEMKYTYGKTQEEPLQWTNPDFRPSKVNVSGMSRILDGQQHTFPSSPVVHKYDFVVIGSGVAGLRFSLAVAEVGKVAVVTKSEPQECSTRYAQVLDLSFIVLM